MLFSPNWYSRRHQRPLTSKLICLSVKALNLGAALFQDSMALCRLKDIFVSQDSVRRFRTGTPYPIRREINITEVDHLHNKGIQVGDRVGNLVQLPNKLDIMFCY